jgi:hypothetical protein
VSAGREPEAARRQSRFASDRGSQLIAFYHCANRSRLSSDGHRIHPQPLEVRYRRSARMGASGPNRRPAAPQAGDALVGRRYRRDGARQSAYLRVELRKALGDSEQCVIAREGEDIVLDAAAFEVDALLSLD